MNTAIKRKDEYQKDELADYKEQFDEKAVDDVMEVGALDLQDLETDFGIIEDERERRRQENQVINFHNLQFYRHIDTRVLN